MWASGAPPGGAHPVAVGLQMKIGQVKVGIADSAQSGGVVKGRRGVVDLGDIGVAHAQRPGRSDKFRASGIFKTNHGASVFDTGEQDNKKKDFRKKKASPLPFKHFASNA